MVVYMYCDSLLFFIKNEVLLITDLVIRNITNTAYSLIEQENKYKNKPVGDSISAPSPNLVAMATRVSPTTFCMVPLIQPSPKTPC